MTLPNQPNNHALGLAMKHAMDRQHRVTLIRGNTGYLCQQCDDDYAFLLAATKRDDMIHVDCRPTWAPVFVGRAS